MDTLRQLIAMMWAREVMPLSAVTEPSAAMRPLQAMKMLMAALMPRRIKKRRRLQGQKSFVMSVRQPPSQMPARRNRPKHMRS